MPTPIPETAARRVRWSALLFVLSLVLVACGGGGGDEVRDCGQDNQTGPRAEWTHAASLCFRDAYQKGQPAFARVVETREGSGLATVEYEADGSDTFIRRVIPSGGVTTVFECTRLGASRLDDRTQLDPLECEVAGG